MDIKREVMNGHDTVWIENRPGASEVEEQWVFMLHQEYRQINLFPENAFKNPKPGDPAFQLVLWPDLFGSQYDHTRFFVSQRFTDLI